MDTNNLITTQYNLIEIHQEEFENFLSKTNLELYKGYISTKGFWSGEEDIAEVIFRINCLEVHTNKYNYPRIKHLFESFVKIYPIEIKIKVSKFWRSNY